ncbi:MAG: FAD-dependent oxidoreductase [Phycisphaerae bacterium]|nr:FAD-dependent oxidoreductase [Phycisphaerae bacterium]MDW8261129.1 NAD(P)/FAD-dependent oxidoreductase [Phycisphaerales bacterium]
MRAAFEIRRSLASTSVMTAHGDVIIVGAGLAGLCAARTLNLAGIPVTIFESSDEVGGRVRTDRVDGFLLDRGFQVYLTSYPEGQRILDYDALGLRPFAHGALIRAEGKFSAVYDPFRHPGRLLEAALSSVGTLGDKLKIGSLRNELRQIDPEQVWQRPETSTLELLHAKGFSDRIIDRFFRSFFGGVFLDRSLATSSRMFEFTFKMFAEGDAAVPDAGMGALARHIAMRLRSSEIRLNTPVARADDNGVTLAGGQRIMARAVIVATDQTSAARLLGTSTAGGWCGTACVYFAAEKPPIDEPLLVLDGDGRGPVNHLAVMSNVSRSYAPSGAHLIAASTAGICGKRPEDLLPAVKAQLTEWFGDAVASWRHLRTYDLPQSLPQQADLRNPRRPVCIRKGLYVCGDHVDQASINGAMESGRRAAEAVIQQLSGS